MCSQTSSPIYRQSCFEEYRSSFLSHMKGVRRWLALIWCSNFLRSWVLPSAPGIIHGCLSWSKMVAKAAISPVRSWGKASSSPFQRIPGNGINRTRYETGEQSGVKRDSCSWYENQVHHMRHRPWSNSQGMVGRES